MFSEELPTLLQTDVLVVGGGPAGVCAAVAAARAGAKVTLIEQSPILGGQSTMARVNIWHTSDGEREVILGLTKELVERLEAYDGIDRYPSFPQRHETYVVSPEYLTIVYDDLVMELGIRVLCYTPCVDAVTSGPKLQGAVVGTKRGLQVVRAACFVDATGDADLGFFAGCETVAGRESNGKMQGMTLQSGWKGLDESRREEIVEAAGPVGETMQRLRDRGELPSFGFDVKTWMDLDLESYAWRWRHSKLLTGGGMIFDAGAHFADMMLHLFGDIDEVTCALKTFDTPIVDMPGLGEHPRDVEDYWVVTLKFASGLFGHWSYSRAARAHHINSSYVWGEKGAAKDRQEWMHAFQFGGDIELEDGTEIPYEEVERQYLDQLADEERERTFPYGITRGMTIECWDFVESVADRLPEVDGEAGQHAKAVCCALYEADHADVPIKVADVLDGTVSAYQDEINDYWGI